MKLKTLRLLLLIAATVIPNIAGAVKYGSLPSYSVLLSVLCNASLSPEDYSADITVTVRRGAMKPRVVALKRVPLSTFLK